MVKADDYKTQDEVFTEIKRLDKIQRTTLDHNSLIYVDYIIYKDILELKKICKGWKFIELQRQSKGNIK